MINFCRDERGPTAVEYAVLLAMIILVAFAAVQLTGGVTQASWEDSNAKLQGAGLGS